MGLFGFLFGSKNNKVNAFKKNGAIILDVKTQGE